MKKILYFVVPIFIGIIFAFGLNKFLDNKIDSLLKSKDLTPLMSKYESEIKEKGVILNDYLLSKGDIMMLGSSELSKKIKRQHPTKYFNSDKSKNKIFIIGRPHSKDLQDVLTLGSADTKNSITQNDDKKKKVVLLVSMQWFLRKDGISSKEFENRFSPEQFYTFLNNKNISKENKDYVAKRVAELLKKGGQYNPEGVYAKLYNDNSFLAKAEKLVLSPYFFVREKLVSLKGKGLLYRALRGLKNEKDKKGNGKPIDWKAEDEQAIKDAKKRVDGNKYKIDKVYYDKVLKKHLAKMKNIYKNTNLLDSTELDDYKAFLNLCQNLNIEPTIVVMPNSKWYYDYTGLSQEERDKYYDTIANLAKEKGFKAINLKDKETEEYYLRDIMHLGTRGWVDVSERLYKEYNEGADK
ncbi:D-alanyl-lipoteichoic acid biosynthesis protein DltD [Clostridium baratii str. Sullivan]|uniref:Protein DltD n=1 Tax=Clostridium baratii str. Sullivan TaxID=1415775 RepID=A0A0A7FW30_9CLOT|nr:D-alanyl-lipoteichoic acid biosynthesis protein DltD [Clostridium baratii]AIY83778.1 D-alanyl-lipoteichoic acid biosynthesis protein DltD [Clostridium baratii str. Sullivan]